MNYKDMENPGIKTRPGRPPKYLEGEIKMIKPYVHEDVAKALKNDSRTAGDLIDEWAAKHYGLNLK